MSKNFNPKNIQKVNIADLVFNDWNPKNDEKDYQKVKRSLGLHGLMTLVFVRETEDGLEVVDGNQRVRAAKELGYTEIYVYNLGNISEVEAKQLVLYFQVQVPFDDVLLSPLVMELKSEEIELPFDEKEMKKFEELEAFDFSTAFEDEAPVIEDEKIGDEEKLKNYRIRLEPEDYELITESIKIVSDFENVNEGRALELLLEAGKSMVE